MRAPLCLFPLLLAAAAAAQADPHRIATLPTSATRVTAGDLTGDGVKEILLGSPSADEIVVHDGQSLRPIATIQGPAGSEFGTALETADRDGDGVDDTLAVGAPGANGTGRVFVYSALDLQNPSPTAVADGPVPWSRFGESLSVGEDANGDGYLDLAVGDPFYDRPGWTDSGAFYAVDGRTGQVTLLLQGSGNAAQFGWRVAGPRSDLDGNPNTFGVVYTAPGYVSGRGAWGKVDYATGATLPGGAVGSSTERLGHSLLVVADATNDGATKVYAGSPLADVGGLQRAGKVAAWNARSAVPLRRYFGARADDQLGLELGMLEGVRDHLAAAGTGGPGNRGKVILFDVETSLEVLTRWGRSDNDAHGSDLTTGDWNGDGDEDVAVVAPGAGEFEVVTRYQQEFSADRTTIDPVSGGTQTLFVDSPAAAGHFYVILGSTSGYSRGFMLGAVHIPVDLDSYTELLNNPLLSPQWGSLDNQGTGQISFTIPPGLLPPGLELTLYHTAVTYDASGAALDPTNPVRTVLR